MAKFLLLEFADDAEADAFTRLAKEGGNAWADYSDPGAFEIKAEFKKPTQFCQCTPKEKQGTTGVRGAKYGWYVCGRCKKPVEKGNQVIFNLLEGGRKTWQREIMLQVLTRYK
jgi:hypothetical protein